MKKVLLFAFINIIAFVSISDLNAEEFVTHRTQTINMSKGKTYFTNEYNQGTSTTVGGSVKNIDVSGNSGYINGEVDHVVTGSDKFICQFGGFITNGQTLSCTSTDSSYANDTNRTRAYYAKTGGGEGSAVMSEVSVW